MDVGVKILRSLRRSLPGYQLGGCGQRPQLSCFSGNHSGNILGDNNVIHICGVKNFAPLNTAVSPQSLRTSI